VTRACSKAGFTLVEMLVATIIMVVITGSVFGLMNPAQGSFQTQPEVSDMQQRMRVASDALGHDIIMAGAGTYLGKTAGALYNFFGPVMPYSPENPGTFSEDVITLMYIPPTPAQTGVNFVQGNGNSQEIRVDPQPNCSDSRHEQLCGFPQDEDFRAILFDIDGSWDVTTVTRVQNEPSKLQYHNPSGGKLSGPYDSGNAVITQIAQHTYYLESNPTAKTYRLMHYDGYLNRLPVVDDVVKLHFDYFGEAQPPQLIPGKTASSSPPWTTYGPKPPELGVDLERGCNGNQHNGDYCSGTDEYGAGENCVFQVTGGVQVPRLAVLGSGLAEVQLTAAQLTDGPWCPSVSSPNRFDADLLRIRHVRVNIRVQVAASALRGPAGVLFTHGGTSTSDQRFVPDQELSFDIAPRNMNLGR
jgi:prepilin-type N-terminal cleavage/methylation domain-containing protein